MTRKKEAHPPPTGEQASRASAPDSAAPSHTAHAGRDAISEPIKVAEFWKNRRGESVRVTLTNYEGRNVVDIRTHWTAKDGTLQPTRKGLTLMLLRLPDLVAALTKAERKARELGLIEAESV